MMMKYIKTVTVLFIFWALFICNNSVSEELKNMCKEKNIKITSVSDDLKLCISEKGLTVKHFNNHHSFKFINHLETQFYLIKTLPSGFLCRDGIFTSRSIPVFKYKPVNGIYLYKLKKEKNNFEPILPAVPENFKIRDYLMVYDQQERRKKIGLALVIYNGMKNESNGSIFIMKKSEENIIKFELKKCRISMTDLAKKINKYTMKRN
jgi:hypothetical protein